ncbi:MAG: tetratricopeptide repeat-containing glycosyltransferase family protein [Aestuariivirga sp.]|nr:tetratricopeptide repeat-containing glycosyltransferase family protein [Aestuariivirga sp.]
MIEQLGAASLQNLVRNAFHFHKIGNLPEAKKLYEKVIARDSHNFTALHFLGVVHYQLGSLEKSVELITHAIKANPHDASAYVNRGISLIGLHRADEALLNFRKAIQLRPDNVSAHCYYAISLCELNRSDEALGYFDGAIRLNSNYVDAYYNKGKALVALKKYDLALTCFDIAIELNPRHFEAHNNRGNVLKEMDKLDQALESYDAAIALMPGYAEAHSNRGNVLLELNRYDESIPCFDRAIALKPDYADAHFNRGLALLLHGDFQSGLPEYEWRKREKEPSRAHIFQKPQWTGKEEIIGRRILVHDEQGLGDTIQFVRYIRLLEGRGANVLLAPQKKLQKLLSIIVDRSEIVNAEDAQLDFEFQCPLASLPLAFATVKNTIPNSVPYLKAEYNRVASWRSRLGNHGFKIGICWQGSTAKIDKGRSFSVTSFHDLSKIEGVRLISLHKGAGEGELEHLSTGMMVENLGPDFDGGEHAFLDTAAVMSCCDLIITSDTSIAHLSGALALPTWVALKHVPDWRWLLGRNDSPWYPTMKLFRQKQRGNWKDVFEEIENSLSELMQSQKTNA